MDRPFDHYDLNKVHEKEKEEKKTISFNHKLIIPKPIV